MDDSGYAADGPPFLSSNPTDVHNLGKSKSPPRSGTTDDNYTIPLPDSNKRDDLMNRLKAFLPQLRAANESLPENGVDGDKQVDLDLESDDDDDDDDDDDEQSDVEPNPKKPALIQEVQVDDSEIQNNATTDDDQKAGIETSSLALSSQPNNDARGQTIQIQFTLGDMTGNPLMQLLAGDDDNDDDDDEGKIGYDQSLVEPEEVPARTLAVANLLLSEGSTSASHKNEISKRRKTLITEL